MTIVDQAKEPLSSGILSLSPSATIERAKRDDYEILAKMLEGGLIALVIVVAAAFASGYFTGEIDETARATLMAARGVF